ncbi:hypothetical protein SAMN06265218_11161 [Fodinibius sediminis]|uniref:Uncharacterized protein n=1 Tax=Fodinibius sediminis TaxID=1214077 RepID=A0A521DMG9_9BACT|nr:hypothetical protein SAMN06265218_11161 [Fodinibius sediminis]
MLTGGLLKVAHLGYRLIALMVRVNCTYMHSRESFARKTKEYIFKFVIHEEVKRKWRVLVQ